MLRKITAALLAALVSWPAAAFWQSRNSSYNNITPAGGGGGTLTFTPKASIANSATSGTSATFSMDIGTASADRFVVVTLAWAGTDDITTVTTNGVSLTKGADVVASSRGQAVWGGAVTAGSGAQNIVVSWTNVNFIGEIVISEGIITGSTTTSRVVADDVTSSAYPSGASAAITVPPNGVAVIASILSYCASNSEVWTNATGDFMTKDLNNVTGGMAHLTTSGTVTDTVNTCGQVNGWVSSSFQP